MNDEKVAVGEFESWNQYSQFSHWVMKKARHLLDARNQRFLDAVILTSVRRKRIIKAGEGIWRAQLGCGWRTEKMLDENERETDSFLVRGPHSPERMVPLSDCAYEGRVNPKGIPCIYFSTDSDTAMTETRPWIGSLVTVAQFVILNNLTVVDCTATEPVDDWNLVFNFGPPEPERREECVWGDINRAFSQPVDRIDNVAEYAPTQVLAEAFRMAGYDGIVYGSKLGTGKTVAVFDLAAAKVANCQLCRVEGVSLAYSEESTVYPP